MKEVIEMEEVCGSERKRELHYVSARVLAEKVL